MTPKQLQNMQKEMLAMGVHVSSMRLMLDKHYIALKNARLSTPHKVREIEVTLNAIDTDMVSVIVRCERLAKELATEMQKETV